MEFTKIPVTDIRRNPYNRKTNEGDESFRELVASVTEHGVLQPVLVRPVEPSKSFPVHFQLIAGERRWLASAAALREMVPAIVRTDLTEQQAVELMLIENLQRKDLEPLEEAAGYRDLMAMGRDVGAIAAKLGRSIKYVYDRVKLLALTDPAQELVRNGKITAGHAILLARLNPKQQAHAIKDGLFTHESFSLLEAEEDATRKDPYHHVKAVSVRELQTWIDRHVRFDSETVEPILFPETAATLAAARDEEEKVIAITHDHHVHPDAKNNHRVYGPASWKPADGRGKAKTCEHSAVGVIVAGPGRGEALKVCTEKKKCKTHWAAEQRESTARTTRMAKGDGNANERWRKEEEKRQAEHARQEAQRERWKKALPAILEAIAVKVQKASARAEGPLAKVLLPYLRSGYDAAKQFINLVPLGKTADDLVRHAAFRVLVTEAVEWRAFEEFPKVAKSFGVNAQVIIDEVAPEKPEPKAQTSAPAVAGKKAKKRRVA